MANRRPATTRPKARSARAKPARSATRRDSGPDTRTRLIESALDVFGRQGFEGASTREIAEGAGANLAAIVYHFGGKEALHVAVAEHIAESVLARIGPTLATIAAPEAVASRDAARAALRLLVGTFLDMMLGEAEAERWARFIVREQLQPTAAFDVLYRFMGEASGIAARLAAAALGRPEDDTIRIRVFTFLGQVLVFRVAQALIFRRMRWKKLGARQRAQVKEIVLAQIGDILDAEEAR